MIELTAVEATRRLGSGDIAAEDYAAALLARCAACSDLNAFISIDPEAVLAAARARDVERRRGRPTGPLFGLPLAVKDNVNTAGLPTSLGTAALRGFRPRTNATIVDRLLAAGAIVLGKTNLHELAMGWTGNNPHFGPVRNPYDRTRLAGGSSSGTAAAVAARTAPAGIGTDTNGSLRIPAAHCGVATLRPTLGRYPTAGIMPLSPTLDTPGMMARSIADLALFDRVIVGTAEPEVTAPRSDLRGTRIGIIGSYYFEGVPSDTADIITKALDRLRHAGAEIVEVEAPELDLLLGRLTLRLLYFEAAQAIPQYLEAYGAGRSLSEIAAKAGPDIAAIIGGRLLPQGVKRITVAEYEAAVASRAALRALFAALFATNRLDALAYPAVRVPAQPVSGRLVSPAPDPESRDGRIAAREAFARNVAPSAAAGLPSLVLPAGLTSSGLPVGIEFAAAEWQDARLLDRGSVMQTALGIPPP
jgi:mandelamide amidase